MRINRPEEVFSEHKENKEIKDIPADELNILICRFTIDMKKDVVRTRRQELSLHHREKPTASLTINSDQ